MRTIGIVFVAIVAAAQLSALPAQAQPYFTQAQTDQLRRVQDPPMTEAYRLWRDQRESSRQRLEREDSYRQRLGPERLYGPRQNTPRRPYYRPYR